MNAGFSGVLRLTDLDDFITPSQECIKPKEDIIKRPVGGTGSKIKIASDGTYMEVSPSGEEGKLSKVEVSLTDCLACSGCITTAETVLISHQSHHRFLSVLSNKRQEGFDAVVVTLSIQPLVSLAVASRLDPPVLLSKLTGLLRRLGVDAVLDGGLGEDLALIEETREVGERLGGADSTLPGERLGGADSTLPLPLLSSSCPGWVCYVEKTKGEMLPHLSRCRSPQQIMGRLVKGVVSRRLGVEPARLYHVALMPCYDKKLEASRHQLADPASAAPDVDCVITPVEVSELVSDVCGEEGLLGEADGEVDWPWEPTLASSESMPLTRPPGSGSGGLAHHVLTSLSQPSSQPPTFKPLKKSMDYLEGEVESGGGRLKGGVVTGFKNIQNLVNKMKRKKCDYTYVEVMACPTGCLNGGAQMRVDAEAVQEMYHRLGVREPTRPAVVQAHASWFPSKQLLTTFEPVTYNPNPLNIKW